MPNDGAASRFARVSERAKGRYQRTIDDMTSQQGNVAGEGVAHGESDAHTSPSAGEQVARRVKTSRQDEGYRTYTLYLPPDINTQINILKATSTLPEHKSRSSIISTALREYFERHPEYQP